MLLNSLLICNVSVFLVLKKETQQLIVCICYLGECRSTFFLIKYLVTLQVQDSNIWQWILRIQISFENQLKIIDMTVALLINSSRDTGDVH